MGEMLPQILQALTRYSANDPKFPVNNDRRVVFSVNDRRSTSSRRTSSVPVGESYSARE